jgi:tetraacyldisaccharide 4'-kinase
VPADARLESAVVSAWQRRGLLAWLLAPLSLVYAVILGARRLAYAVGLIPVARLAVPVVVIGNLYVGGTGKTPLTIALVQALRQRGWRPGVVSRGYGRASSVARIVAADDPPADVGDEPLVTARATAAPVAVGAARGRAAQLLLASHPECDVLIADDGLQHLRLARDLELALLDDRGLGNGWLLPAGPLREPAARLRRVDAIVQHRSGGAASTPLPAEAGEVPNFAMVSQLGETIHRLGDRSQTLALAELARRQRAAALTITAAAGIGVPQRFFDMLRAAGLAIEERPLPDHYDFQDPPFESGSTHLVLVTEKDAVKCERIDALRKDPRFWVVPLQARIDDDLVDFVAARLEQHRKSPHGSSAA